MLTNIDMDESHRDLKSNHVLYIVRDNSQTKTPILSYDRNVEVVVSPHQDRLAINDRRYSNQSLCYLVFVKNPEQKVLLDQLAKEATPDDHKNIWDNSHLYVEAKNWKDNEHLILRVWGYNPKGFDVEFLAAVPSNDERAISLVLLDGDLEIANSSK